MINVNDIIDIIRDNEIKVDIEKSDYNDLLMEQGFDSLDMTTILFSIEENYQIKISEDDIEKGRLSSINAIVEYVNSKVNLK